MTEDHWRTADFSTAVAEPGGRRLLPWIAGLLALTSAVLLVVSWGRDATRCGESCYGRPAQSRYGSLTYESGHPWTSYADSWQWGAQNGVAHVALLAALVGLGLMAMSRRSPAPALWVAAVAMATWTVWVLTSPAVG